MMPCEVYNSEAARRMIMGRTVYLEIHLSQLVTPFHQESRTDVKVELRECIWPLCLKWSKGSGGVGEMTSQ